MNLLLLLFGWRSSWQKRVAGLDLETEPWLIIHNVLLLELLDCNSSSPSELMDELTRATHSRAARLYSLMHLNRSLRELIYKFEPVNLEVWDVVIFFYLYAWGPLWWRLFCVKIIYDVSFVLNYRIALCGIVAQWWVRCLPSRGSRVRIPLKPPRRDRHSQLPVWRDVAPYVAALRLN